MDGIRYSSIENSETCWEDMSGRRGEGFHYGEKGGRRGRMKEVESKINPRKLEKLFRRKCVRGEVVSLKG